jgi:ribonuclease Z
LKPFKVTILGSGSATPTKQRNPSSQLVNIHDHLLLIDCGEGTQMQFRKYNIKYNRINHIFISHLHGDHYLGLMGLLFTFHLYGRKTTLNLYAPSELADIIDLQLKVSDSQLVYPLKFHPLQTDVMTEIHKTNTYSVSSFPLKHSIPTWGFFIKEINNKPKVKKSFIEKENPSIREKIDISNGADYVNSEGVVFKNEEITVPPAPCRSYAYCSDTMFDETIIDYIQNVNTIYHEATFSEELKDISTQKHHSTAIEAATIAAKANAKQLIIGHFSARYEDTDPLLSEAESVFRNTIIAEDGLSVEIL